MADFNYGWIFCREGVNLPDICATAALCAVEGLSLHFGAVDLGWHPEFGVHIYEVNTAPGLEGQTLVNYAQSFQNYVS